MIPRDPNVQRVELAAAALGELRHQLVLVGGCAVSLLIDSATASPPRVTYDVDLIAYLPQAATNVGRGENSGRTLKEFNVVRQFRSLGVWNGQESVFHAPMDSFPGDATRIAVLLQRTQQGPIIGSATALLR